MKILLCLFLVIVSVYVTYGATSFGEIQTEKVYGKTVKFCVYKGLRMLPKSSFIDYDTCSRCTCKKTGLSCATLSTAFSVNYPDDSKCDNVRIGCVNRWVMKKNTKKRCPKPLI
ncbi:beta-microseminoprotein-like, partial [Ruditapes philippinarum]|uniref:beta-microseminoprotein-like n=1 Tax=Ruditapes philippinarum TaxID=129788 RepID=UPI00295B0F5E